MLPLYSRRPESHCQGRICGRGNLFPHCAPCREEFGGGGGLPEQDDGAGRSAGGETAGKTVRGHCDGLAGYAGGQRLFQEAFQFRHPSLHGLCAADAGHERLSEPEGQAPCDYKQMRRLRQVRSGRSRLWRERPALGCACTPGASASSMAWKIW